MFARSKILCLALCAALFACTSQPPAPAEITSAPEPLRPSGTPAIFKQPAAAPSHPSVAPPEQDVIIGMLLPLSGPQAEIGNHMQDAALMGLYDKLNSLTSLQVTRNPRLLIKDTGGDAETTRKMTQELLASGARIILGPLLSDHVKIVAREAKAGGVPVISFSNNTDVAEPGVFIFGFRPQEQVERIARFALKQQIHHYAALAPQNEYARTVVRQFSDVVKADGRSLQPVNFFAEDGMPPAPILNRIVNTTAEWGDKRKGVFLPVTGQSLHGIANRLMQDKNINPAFVKLLGTGLWDDDSVLRIPAMQGAWFATSSPEKSRRFNTLFETAYGYKPVRLASLAYDAVALAATLALAPAGPDFSLATLTETSGFSGPANGVFRFLPNGISERGMAVVEVTAYGFQVIDPAPQSF